MEKLETSFELRHPQLSQEVIDAHERRLVELNKKQSRRRHLAIANAFLASIPPRFATATLHNWFATTDDQKTVLETARQLALNPPQLRNINLIFSGPVGTGKDHLAIALLRVAAESGITALYRPARDVYLEIGEAYKLGTVRETYQALVEPQILCLSDPLEPRNWTPARADMLARIIHARYDRIRATWITANLPADRALETACEMAGAEVIDRLTETSLTIRMRWDSYRQRQT